MAKKKYEKDINTLNYAPMISMLYDMGKDPSLIFNQSGVSEEYLMSTRNYIDLQTGIKIFNAVKEILADPDPMIFYDLGLKVIKFQNLGPLLTMGRAFGTIEQSVRYIKQFNRKFNDIFDMNTYNISKSSGIVSINYKKRAYDGVWIFDQSIWNQGVIGGMPSEYDLPFMNIESPINRFSLEELVGSYKFTGHKFHNDPVTGRSHLNGKEFAAPVILKQEDVRISLHKLDPSYLFNEGKVKKILTNIDAEIVEPHQLADLRENPWGMMIVEDTKISDRMFLKKGQVFAASDTIVNKYRLDSRLDIQWSSRKKISRTLKDSSVGRLIYGNQIIAELNEELDINNQQTREIIELNESLEGRVFDRTQELKEKNEILQRIESNLRKYLPKQLAETITRGDHIAVPKTERRKMSIFFSDIKGFTDLTESLEAEELASLLNEYLTEMTEIAHKWGGTVDKFIGDAIMIFFGAPEKNSDEKNALNCVRMAIDMQARMTTLQSKWYNDGIENPLRIRIGISTGTSTVGNFGTEDRLSYTVIGSQVNIASRLEALCEPDKILISHPTWALVKDEVDCTPHEKVNVKGINREIMTYNVALD